MKRILILLLLPLISGCFTTEIVTLEPDTYTVSNRGESYELAKQEPIVKANKFCFENGLNFMAISENEKRVGTTFEYQLTFKCLTKEEYESR